MLNYISIKNIVLIEKLELNFEEGFTVLTGETGAGKSIIVDAINLILGNRADKRLIKKGESEASVSALFSIKNDHEGEVPDYLSSDIYYYLYKDEAINYNRGKILLKTNLSFH